MIGVVASDGTAMPEWRQLGAGPAVDRTGRVWGWLAAFVIAVAGPAGWAVRIGRGGTWWLIVAVGLVAVTLTRRSSSTVALAAAAASGIVVGAESGRPAGAWLVFALLAARAITAPEGRTVLSRQAAAPAVVLSIVAGVSAAWDRPVGVVALAALSVVVVPYLMSLGGGHLVKRVDAFAAFVGTSLSWVLFGVMSLPMVVVPHVAGRLARADGFGAVGHWARPPVRRGAATSMWSNDRPGALSIRRGLVRVGAVFAVIALIVWSVDLPGNATLRGFVLAVPTPSGPEQAPQASGPQPTVVLREPVPADVTEDFPGVDVTPVAESDNDWWASDDFQDAEDYILDMRIAWRYENPFRVLDVNSRYINIVDGIRKSWTPPPCDCRRLKVWMYGGSTAWGIGQRDEHTIASELARVAYENGITIDIDNRGLTGFSHWMEAERFAWDLSTGERPDLVVFYDGVNEIYLAGGDNDIRATSEAPVNPALVPLWNGTGRKLGPKPEGPEGAKLIDTTDPVVNPAQRSFEVIERYNWTRKMSQKTAAYADVPVKYIWQPSRYSRPLVPIEPHWAASQENDMRLVNQVTSDNLDDDVIDLSDAMDDDLEPIFTDDVHHNELGSRIMAEAIFESIESDLEKLSSSPG